MSTYRLEIDGSGAEQGAQTIVRSFKDIKEAADKMEGGVSAAARKASQSFGELQKNVRPVSDQAIRQLKELGGVFRTFRAPSDAAVRNTVIFLQGIKSVGALNLGRITGLASLLAAISGYRGPSPTAGKNTLALLNALRFAASYSNPRGLAATLAALSSFRGPSAAASRNVASLLIALANFRAPRGLSAVASALNAITSAANQAASGLGRVKSITASGINVKMNTSQATAATSSLIRQQNFLQTALLRTQTAWNTLGGVFAAKVIVTAANDIIKIKAQLEAATGSIQNARVQFNFLKEQTQLLGLEFRETARSYGFFLGSIKGSGLTLREAQEIFRGFSVAARALQLSTSDVDGIFRALGQIMSKGKLQAEELRQQLGDRLPGAFIRFAKALDMTRPGELDAALKKGAISGERLRKAVIDVARSLEVEFLQSADKMSRTVDAAFNRLRNSFTFAADSLGRSGLNEAIINLFDTMRKFLESEGFDRSMKILAGLFKILGDNIELVANVLGFLAVNATLKWLASLQLLNRAVTFFTSLRAASVIGSVAVATSGAAAATGRLTKAFALMGAVVRANPIFFLTAIIMGVLYAFQKLTDTMTEQKEAMNALNGKMADAQNYFDAIIQKQVDLAATTGDTTNEIYKQIHAMHQLALEGSAQGVEGFAPGYNNPFSAFLGGKPSGVVGPQGVLSKEDQAIFNKYFYREGQQYKLKNLSGGATTPDATGFKQLTQVGAILQARIQARNPANPESDPLFGALNTVRGRFNALTSLSQEPGYKGNPYAAWAGRLGGDYNRYNTEGSGLTGSPIESAKRRGKSEAEKWSEELERNLRTAEKALTDLQLEAEATSQVVNDLLSGSLDAAGASAVQAAQSQLKNFEDTFDSVEKAQMGTQTLAQRLLEQGKLAADANISTYADAKRAVIDYFTSVQATAIQMQKVLDVANNVAEMRENNAVSESYVDALKNQSNTLAEANKQQEINQQLVGITDEKIRVVIDGVEQEVNARTYLYDKLSGEIDKRNELNRQIEYENALREKNNQSALNQYISPMLQSGMKKEDIDYYRDMFEYRQKLIDQGWSGIELRNMVNLHAATLNEARAMEILEDQYEKMRQVAQDMADAIVDGFKQATSGGDNFLKSIKNIFKQLKDIILDFILWNPLKQFLANSIQGMLGQTQGGANVLGGTGYTTQTASSPLAAAGSSLMSFAGSAFASALGGGGGGGGSTPAHTWSEQGGYLVPVFQNRGGMSSSGSGDIVVTGVRSNQTSTGGVPIPAAQRQQQMNFFEGIERVFNYKANGKAIGDLAKSIGAGGKGLGAAIGPAIGAAMNAYAGWQMGNTLGKGFAKAIGLGGRGQNIVGGMAGGAMAGYSVGGPIGAAVGAIAGGIIGLFKKVPKIPSSYGSVVVGEGGYAELGAAGKYGKGSTTLGGQLGSAGATLFNQFAIEFGGNLTPGSYGSFGRRKIKNDDIKGESDFYSVLGTSRKGKPLGQRGIDWISGTQSEVQAFALIQQVRRGMITGLSDTIKQIFGRTKSTTMEGLQGDLQIGEAYDQFVRSSIAVSDLSQNMIDLQTAFKKLNQQAKSLGLSETKLAKARDNLVKQMRDEFNFNISQGILEFTNPQLAAYNDLVKEYKATVENAIAVGGDLAAVEEYYGLKRAEILKQTAETANNGILSAAKDLYTQLTASQNSPLNAGTIFRNAQDLYMGLRNQILGGDYQNVDKLEEYSGNYLDAARSMYSSSTGYFDVFNEVTEFLKNVMDIQEETPGSGGTVDIPALPDIDTIVDEIYAKNQEIVEATGAVGLAVINGSGDIVEAIENLGNIFGGGTSTGTIQPTQPGIYGATGIFANWTYKSAYSTKLL